MTKILYDTDFYAWLQRQALLLKNEDFAELDLPNLIEEIEGMARSDRRALINRLRVLLTHLLKLSYEPEAPSVRGWKATIKEQRMRIKALLADSPSLSVHLPDFIQSTYLDARELAADAAAASVADFPTHCPWTLEQILDVRWLP